MHLKNISTKKHIRIALSFLLVAISSPGFAEPDVVQYAGEPIMIDGEALEHSWKNAQWRNIDKHILGEYPSREDFSGRYKLLWDEQYLYLLAEISDDVLFDQHADPLLRYWDDDCLEIFIDEDGSGGNHQFDFNAFAYHVALDNQAVDIGGRLEDGSPEYMLLNEHVSSQWKRQADTPHTVLWEVSIRLFDDGFHPDKLNQAVSLSAGKTMGFMLAYCDNDGSEEREHFIGSHEIEPVDGDKNLGYIDADVFGSIRLVAPAD